MERLGITLLGQAVYPRAAGIRQTHHLGTFVKSLARRVIDSLPDDLHVVVSLDQHYLAVAAADQQTQERELGMLTMLAILHKMRQHVALQVVDIHQRNTQTQRQALGKRGANQQRAQQSRAAGERNSTELLFLHSGTLEGRIHYGHDILLMRPGGQLRNDTTVLLVHFLRRNHVALQHAITNHGRGRVVARTFYA